MFLKVQTRNCVRGRSFQITKRSTSIGVSVWSSGSSRSRTRRAVGNHLNTRRSYTTPSSVPPSDEAAVANEGESKSHTTIGQRRAQRALFFEFWGAQESQMAKLLGRFLAAVRNWNQFRDDPELH